jgi:hypothetical protein
VKKSVRNLFRDELGVIKIESGERRFKRGYCSLIGSKTRTRLWRQPEAGSSTDNLGKPDRQSADFIVGLPQQKGNPNECSREIFP